MWNPEFEQVSQDEHKQTILAAAKRLLERPFLALGKPLVSLNVRNQFRYATEYLVREGYPNNNFLFLSFPLLYAFDYE